MTQRRPSDGPEGCAGRLGTPGVERQVKNRAKAAGAVAGEAGPLLELRAGGRRVPEGDDGRWLWRDADLRLDPGELVVVAGPTGSGKSLLLRALASLDALDEGQIRLEGRPVEDWPVTRLRHRVTYLHQSPALFPGSVEDNFREPFEWHEHRRRGYRREYALHLLDPLGRGEAFLARDVSELSGGERQIVAVVRAMLLEPRVLLLDEPTAALDPGATSTVEELVRNWITDERSAVWVSHDREQARRVGDRGLLLRDGELRADGEGPRS